VKATYADEEFNDQQIRAMMGTVNLVADRYTDKMCLIQSRNSRDNNSGKLCVNKSFKFGVIKRIQGNFEANGIIGLSPSRSSESYINALWEQGVITSRIVGLNFENPMDNDQQSKISIGQIDYNEVEEGVNGIRYYTNIATEGTGWGIIMDSVSYNGKNVTGSATDHSKIAFIDSGNTSIQVPESVFENLLNEMRTKEKSIGSYPVDDKTILVAH
jgi:hypothetical protein